MFIIMMNMDASVENCAINYPALSYYKQNYKIRYSSQSLTTTEKTVYWGDDGVNIKAMDLNSGTRMNMMSLTVLALEPGLLQEN